MSKALYTFKSVQDCYEEGARDESRPRCTQNFPKSIDIELAAHIVRLIATSSFRILKR